MTINVMKVTGIPDMRKGMGYFGQEYAFHIMSFGKQFQSLENKLVL